MQAVGLHPDVVVVTSRFWQTTCTLVRAGEEAFCVDSPVLPDELEVLPSIADQAGFHVVGLLATHGDWDHLLGRSRSRTRRWAWASRPRALHDEPGAAQRALREFDEEHYIVRPRPLSLPEPQTLPVPGHCAVGDRGARAAPR